MQTMLAKLPHNLFHRTFAMAFVLLMSLAASATLKDNTEYYIWLNIYEKLLGSSADGADPAISAYGTSADAGSYIFVAEPSGKSGYVLLRQKSTNRYLAASAKNSYSIVFENTKSTDDRYCWKADEGTYVYLINKKTGKYVGVDGANKSKDYVSIYCDKPKGSHSQMSAIPVSGDSWNSSRWTYASAEYTNAQGVREIDYCQLNGQTIDRSDAVDIHITCNDNAIQGSTSVNLGSEDTWLIFDNMTSTQVVSFYMKHITIKGEKAVKDKNCRLAIYLNGTVVMPKPATVMSCSGTEGDFTLDVKNYPDLTSQSNTMTSFTLKRGHMATLATGTNGAGYSRVYVADHSDLHVNLPKALVKRVSSVNVKRWQYLSKKGWADTAGSSKGGTLKASWFWSWSAGYSSTAGMEYVPCRQHRYWPSANEVNSKTSTAAFSLNEPEHPEQHTSQACSCGGTINEWTACTITPDFFAGGGRIGSPQPTDFSYLTNYFKHVDDMSYRCDFAVTHAYWDISGRSEADYANWFASQCKSIYSSTGRPLWITEMEIGSSWGEKWDKYSDKYGTYRKYLQVLLQKLEECDYVERYAIYTYDNYWSKMFYDDGGITPAGQVYRDHRSTFAYHGSATKEPVWWTPGMKEPTLDYKVNNAARTITFTMGNTNGDAAETLVLQRKTADGWADVYAVEHRSDFEKNAIDVTISLDDIDRDNDMFRVATTNLYGGEAASEVKTTGYIANPGIYASSKSSVDGWTCVRNAGNGFTKAESGDTYLEVWNQTASDIDFDYHQDIKELPDGVYRLSAACFNSTNNVPGTEINGNMGLYAVASGTLFFSPVTTDSEMDYSRRTVVDSIIVSGGTMRIGIRNIGRMGGRWAGADDFRLEYICSEEELSDAQRAAILHAADEALLSRFDVVDEASGMRDVSGMIANASCSRGTKDMWTAENVEVKSGEAYDGNKSNMYFDFWKNTAYTSTMTQQLGVMPEGEYTLTAIVRSTANLPVTLSAAVQGDEPQTCTESVAGTGNVSPDGSEYENGWQTVSIGSIKVKRGDTLTIGLSVSAASTAWWSADSFTLTCKPSQKQPEVPDAPDSIDGVASSCAESITYTLGGVPATDVTSKNVRIVKQQGKTARKVIAK